MCIAKRMILCFLLIIATCLYSSCVKEYYYYGDADYHNSSNTDNNNSTGKISVNFSATIEDAITATRASGWPEPLPKGCYVNIYVYNVGDYPGDGNYIYMGVYRATRDGYISPQGNTMMLEKGLYNFYATSAYNFDQPKGPQFNNTTGIATDLYNGIDYLWWKDENVLVSKYDQTISILFSRCCAKLTFEMEAAYNHTLNSVTHFDITTSTPSECRFSLRTGKITPSTTVTTSKQMCDINGTEASVVILPLDTWKNLTATIYATVDNKGNWYTLSVPHKYSDIYRAGYEYEYELKFNGTSVN